MAKARRGRNEDAFFFSKTQNLWIVRVIVNGKRYTASSKSKEKARLKLIDLQAKRTQGLLKVKGENGRPTIEQVVRAYVEFGITSGEIRESTAYRYEGIIKKLTSEFGPLPVAELTRDRVKAFYAKEYKKTTPATVLKTHNLISAALKEAVEEGIVTENVCAKNLRPSVSKEEIQAFSEAETNTLLAFVSDTQHRDFALLRVAFRTGLRSGELLGLRWSDVDLKAAKLTVNQTLVNFGKPAKPGKPKSGKTRTIDLARDAVAALREQQTRLLAEGLRASEYVFPNTKGNPGNRNHLLQRFKMLCKNADVPILKFHSTRHTFASLAIKAGVDYKTIQKILGHYSVALTIDTYAHLAEDAQRTAVEKMDRLFA